MRYQPKYAELQDKIWLEQKYVEEQLSSTVIGEIIGCHRTSVVVALRRHGIGRRNRSEATKLVPNKCRLSIFEFLNDKDWLYQKYVTEQLSTKQILVLVGGKTPNSVRQALIRHGIKVRNIREGLVCGRVDDGFILDKHTQQVIEGGLLGDACMSIFNRASSICAPAFRRRNKFRDHVEFVCGQLGCDLSRVQSEWEKAPRGKKSLIHSFRTLTHDCLVPLYRKWYPAWNSYKKIVPLDLILTPTILLHWFLDDGSSSWRNRKYQDGWKQRKKQVVLSFSSESFTKEENQFLCEQMKDLFDIPCSVATANSGTGWRVRVRQSGVPEFFDVIGSCPIQSLAYKWKNVRN